MLVLSVLAAEDADFYRHRGLDYAGILRALMRDMFIGKPMQGASTITQQIVKNVLLTPERTIARKVKELILARRLEQELSKDEILHLYLNHINFGHGRYGVQEAARFYFGKDVSKLELAEASLLAGLPQAPARLSPLQAPAGGQAAPALRARTSSSASARSTGTTCRSRRSCKARATRGKAGRRAARTQRLRPRCRSSHAQLLEQLVGETLPRSAAATASRRRSISSCSRRHALRCRRGLRAIDTRHKLLGPLLPPKQRKRAERVPKLDRRARATRRW